MCTAVLHFEVVAEEAPHAPEAIETVETVGERLICWVLESPRYATGLPPGFSQEALAERADRFSTARALAR